MMHNNDGYYFGGMHFIGWFLLLAFLVVIIGLLNRSRKK